MKVLVLALLLAVAGSTDGQVTPIYYRVVMDTAMWSGEPKSTREIVLDLEQTGDHWGSVFGVARSYNMSFHKGAVAEAKVSGNEITMHLTTDITADKWIPGGQGDYALKFTRNADGTLSGTFTGKYNGAPMAGKVSGLYYAPKFAADFVPLTPQEHPRLLFRKADLTKLREKAKTPFGQAAMSKLEADGTPAALGLLYQITGDKKWAEKAEKEAEFYLDGRKPPASPFVPQMAMWGRLEQLALVYDLCYDALSPDFKARVKAWVADFAFQVYFAPETLGGNWQVVSNHVANVFSGLLLNMLAMFDEPAPAPAPPSAPFLDETLPAAKDFTPGKDVPVVPFTPGKSPTQWIHTEALRRATPDDPREVFYGLEKINPASGTKVKVGDFELTFGPMKPEEVSKEDIGGLGVGHMIEADAKAKAKEPFTMVAYTVVEMKEPGQFVVQCPVSRANLAQVAIAGKLLADGQVVKLEKGLYPVMCMVQWRMKWGAIAPLFRVATDSDGAAWQTKAEGYRQKYQTALQSFETLKANWQRSGGGDPALGRLFRLTRFTSWLHCTDAVGKGGFQAEVGHYSEDAMSGHGALWAVYRRVIGYDLTPDNEYPDAVPRYVIGGPQDINGTTALHPQFIAGLFPSLREEWKPELLTAWLNAAKAKGDDITAVLDHDPVRAFINYPLDLKPAPIGTKLPLVWEAPSFGYYAFRSGWDKDAFIAQVFLKNQHISGWNGENAGTFRLFGLGQVWAGGTGDRVRRREQENVVWFPDADLSDGACGRLAFFEAKDKTMSLTANLDEVYERNRRFRYASYGNLRLPSMPNKDEEPIPASGIAGIRALAFDYSKLSGAECLFAIVDKIQGGADAKRFWLFQPPSLSAVKPDERGFTVAGNKASLRGVFALPGEPKVSTSPLSYEYIKGWGTSRGTKVKVTINAITVAGSDNFFFVGTVTSGEQPAINVQGTGLDAVVTVGQRTIKFDGQRIILGTR